MVHAAFPWNTEHVTDHYFTPGAGRRREVPVTAWGRTDDYVTADGLFSADGLDHATAILLEASTPPTTGRVLDLGCGWGPIACSLALAAPDCEVWGVDVTPEALELTSENARRLGVQVHAALPDDVPDDLEFDALWSNPPIRIGKDALHDMLLHWLPRLVPGGEARLVVGKNLGADSLQKWLIGRGWRTERVAGSRGFRILSVRTYDPPGGPA